jgi:hypothetical protein
MKLIKIAVLMKKRFAEFYEVRIYRKHSAEQLIVKKYFVNSQEIIVDGEK